MFGVLSKLSDTCSLSLGYTFRTRLESDPAGAVRVVQMRDIDARSQVHTSAIITVRFERPKSAWLLKEGDLLFQSRGMTNTAALVPAGLGLAMAASPLMVLRPDPQRLRPGFLRWFLNHPRTQAELLSRSTVVSTRFVSLSVLSDLVIPLPPLAQQEKIAAVMALAEREEMILEAIRAKRKAFLEEVLMQATQ